MNTKPDHNKICSINQVALKGEKIFTDHLFLFCASLNSKEGIHICLIKGNHYYIKRYLSLIYSLSIKLN